MPTNSFEHFYLSWMPEKGKIKRPCYLTLANALEADIVSGKLASGTKLPPQRELADYLDLNFTTVTQAYNLCRERRLIYGVTGKGTFVSPLPGKNIIHHSGSQEGIIELGLLKGFDQIKTPIIEASKKVLQKGYIEELYSYTEVAGHLHQRVAGAHWMKQMDVHTDSEHTAIFSGAQNIISATLLSLFKIGDKIAVDEYTYSNLLGMARLSHIRLIPVRGDADGVIAALNEIEEIESCTLEASHEEGVVALTLKTKSDADLRDRIFFAMADRRYAVISMEREEESLESVFLRLTDDAPEEDDGTSRKKAKKKLQDEPDMEGEYELIEEEEEKN